MIQTPESALSQNKENVPPVFEYPNPSSQCGPGNLNSNTDTGGRYEMGDDEEFEAEKDRIFKEYKKLFARLKALITTYNPDSFDARILKLNKVEWMKQVQDKNGELHELFLDLDDDKLSEADKALRDNLEKAVNESVQKFIIAFDLKVLSLDDTEPVRENSSTSSGRSNNGSMLMNNLSRMAESNVRVDLEKLASEIKDLSSEVKEVEDWSDVHQYDIEVAMGKI